jgi:transposase
MRRPSTYPGEFRREAVQLVLSSEESRAAIARRLGVNGTSLRNWVAAHLAEEARQSDPLATASSEFEELRRLRRRSPSCGPSATSSARQRRISPRRRSGLPLPVRRRVPTRLWRQAALSSLGVSRSEFYAWAARPYGAS